MAVLTLRSVLLGVALLALASQDAAARGQLASLGVPVLLATAIGASNDGEATTDAAAARENNRLHLVALQPFPQPK